MKLSVLRLLASTALMSVPAHAAFAQQPVPPEHYTLDPRGVDLVHGTFNYTTTEVVIGQPGNGGMAYGRTFVGSGNGWRDTLLGTINVSGSTYVVSVGGESEIFTRSGSTFTPVSNNGSTLSLIGTTGYKFISSSGTIANFFNFYANVRTPYLANAAILSDLVRPNGERLDYQYNGQVFCERTNPDGDCEEFGTAARLQSVTNNRGYQIHYNYVSDDPTTGLFGSWFEVASVIGINSAVDYCTPGIEQCTGLTQNWPSVTYGVDGSGNAIATDQMSRTTTYTNTAPLTFIRLPGSSVDNVAISYSSGQVSGVTDATGAWTYGYSTSGSTGTTTVSGPLSQSMTVVSDLSIGRATAVTQVTSISPSASSTWSYAYDGQRRLSRTTNPEGDYVDLTYDGRGNVTQQTAVAKSGSGLSNIVTSSVYPSTCSNTVTCNKPTSTTDARGNVTDYTWDSTHGGVLTVTQPAPTSGADRPQTRYTYATQTAYIKNSGGSIVSVGSSVTLPTVISACATGTSCANASNEVRTTTVYGSAGVANNLLRTSVSQGSGASPAIAVVTATYTPDGDVATTDGPLSGTSDTTLYRYDDARQRIGVVGPDPDGGGAALNRAQRLTYNASGQVTLAETGTTPGYTDPNWASFSAIIKTATTYDSYLRPVETRQQSGAGSTVSVTQVTYDTAGRPSCTALRMNPATYSSLPSSACTAASTGSDGPDRIVQATYDAAGRVVTTTSALGLSEVITQGSTYTANGQTASLTDGNGNVSITEYDGFNRPVKLRYPNATGGGTSTTDYQEVTYDAAGNVVTARNRAGGTTSLTTDNLNRVTNVDAPSGTMDVATTYDNLGRVLTSAGNSQTLTNVWDPLSRLTSETGPLGAMSYQYDARGAMTRITWPDSVYVQYDRDLYAAVTAIRLNGASSGADVLATYAYNDLGQTTGIVRGNGAATSYGYDAWGRLSGLSHDLPGSGSDVVFGYAYNAANQIVSRTVSNASYVSAASASDSYSLNGRNQITAINGGSVTYDGNQNATGVLGDSYGYDAANRLTSGTVGGTGYSWVYDPTGRLYDNGAGALYQYAGSQLVGEYNSSGVLGVRHVPGPGLDQPVASSWSSGRIQQIPDERGSIIATVDGSGTVNINTYDEYGVPNAANRFQYTGQPIMAPGLYNYRARAYLPEIGRFLQTDPAGYAAGQNIYAYVGEDPVNLTDPSGLTWITIGWDFCSTVHTKGFKDETHCRPDDSVTFWQDDDEGGSTGVAESADPRFPAGTPRIFPMNNYTQICAPLQRLMMNGQVVRATYAAWHRSELSQVEEGFWITIDRSNHLFIDPVASGGEEIINPDRGRPAGNWSLQVFVHTHSWGSGISDNDKSNGNRFPIIAVTLNNGVAYNCPTMN